MSDVHKRGAQPALQLDQLHAHGGAQLGVQVGQRLVHQEHRRLLDHGAGQSDALALAARQLAGLAVEVLGQADDCGILLDESCALRLRNLSVLQAEFNVFAHGHGGINGVILEDHRDIALGGIHVGDVLAVHQNASGGRGTDACDHSQQGRLSAAGGTNQNSKLSVLNGQVQIFDDLDLSEGLAYIFEFNLGHVCFLQCIIVNGEHT